MAQEKTIQLSDSAIQTVKRLETNDRLLVSDSSGGMKRIAPADFVNSHTRQLSCKISTSNRAAEWIRVLTLDVASGGDAGIISIANLWSNTEPAPVLLAFAVSSAHFRACRGSSITRLIGQTTVFTKARVVYPDESSNKINVVYIDVYKNVTSENTIVLGLGASIFGVLPETYTVGTIPEGYTSKEFSLIGGVNHRFTKSCKALHLLRFRKQRPRRGLTAARSRRKTEYCLISY